MKVAAFQFDVRRADVDGNLVRVEQGLRRAAADGIALVVLPEMWPTSFVEVASSDDAAVGASEAAVERLREFSGELGLVVAGSAFARIEGATLPRNRLHVFDRGERVLSYDKAHLFSPSGEREAFSAGNALPTTVATAVGDVSGAVCYDLRFGAFFRAAFEDEAEILLVPAQWPAPRAAQWRALAIGRAIELQALVVAANRTGTASIGRQQLALEFSGNSLVVGPEGEVLAEGRGEEGLVAAELDLEQVRSLRKLMPLRCDARRDLY